MARARVKPEPATTAALGLSTLSERLRAASARHDELVARVARRQAVRDALVSDTRTAVTHVVMRMQTLLDEGRRLEREVHQLMQALLDDPKRPRRQRAELERIYQDLEAEVIRPREHLAPAGGWDEEGAPREEPRGRGRARASAGEGGGGPELAPQKPRPAERGTLRDLFRRLAAALHPDKVQDEGERARRTEVMKQVTVAYQDGDYARLVQIEQAWASAPGLGEDALADDELERRLAVKEGAVAELEAQLAAIERELRRLRASADARLARDYQRHGGAAGRTPDEQQADEELARLREVRDFIVAFREGEIDFERFCAGPGDPDVVEDDDAFALVDELLGGRGRPSPELEALLAELDRMARRGDLDPRDILRAVQAAAHGAGVGPRPRPRRR